MVEPGISTLGIPFAASPQDVAPDGKRYTPKSLDAPLCVLITVTFSTPTPAFYNYHSHYALAIRAAEFKRAAAIALRKLLP